MPASGDSGLLRVEGGKLYYEAAGTGEPLVFVHGFTLDARMWDDQWEGFADRYRVVRYDVRGFGRSDLPTGLHGHHTDLRAIVEHLGLVRPHLVGLSMGGGIVLNYAISHPGEVRSLSLIDSMVGGWTDWSADELDVDDIAKREGVDAARAAWYADPFFAPAADQPHVLARLHAIVDDYSGWHWLNGYDSVRPDPPALGRLNEVRVPTLVVIGERDVPDFQRIADSLVEGIAGARKAVIRGVGHMANMEAPGEVNRVLAGFLASAGGRPQDVEVESDAGVPGSGDRCPSPARSAAASRNSLR